MESRQTTKLEFIKQPHVLVMIAVISIVFFIAVFTAIKRVSNSSKLSSLDTYDACRYYIKDDNLCRYASQSEKTATNGKVITITETEGLNIATTTINFNSPDKYSIYTKEGNKLTDSIINVGQTVYEKSETDANFQYSTVDDNSNLLFNDTKYDFTRENSEDVRMFVDNYKYSSREKCGQLTCYKYEIKDSSNPSAETYIWFDTTDFILRKSLELDSNKSTTSLYEYKDVEIEAPDNATEASSGSEANTNQLEKALQQELDY